MRELPYKVHKTRKGKIRVKYDCPSCQTPLENELAEAGIEDSCPDCGTKYLVPGVDKRIQVEDELKRQAQARKKAEADKAAAAAQRNQVDEAAKYAAASGYNAYMPPPPAPEASIKARQVASIVSRKNVTNIDYPALELYATILKVLGWICIIVGVVIAGVFFVAAVSVGAQDTDAATADEAFTNALSQSAGLTMSLVMALTSLVGWLLLAFCFFVASEFIRLVLDARRDLARIAG